MSTLRQLLVMFCLGSSLLDATARQSNFQQEARWQLSKELVARGAHKKYLKKVDELQQGQLLDTDAQFLERLNNVTNKLATQAALDYTASDNWQWEVHSSDQSDESSYCMAGGKLIISRYQVRELALNETELAMLVAHEMAHALLLHHYAEDQEALRLFPMWRHKSFEEFETAVDDDDTLVSALAELGKQQEIEADLSGMQLALKAGYPAKGLLSFFVKLSKHNAYPNFDSRSHPAPAQRLQRLRDWLLQAKLIAVN